MVDPTYSSHHIPGNTHPRVSHIIDRAGCILCHRLYKLFTTSFKASATEDSIYMIRTRG